MKRLRVFFAIILFCCALPLWRLTDFLAVLSPFHWPLSFGVTLIFALFVLIPVKLLLPKIKTYFLIPLILGMGLLSWVTPTFSPKATRESTFNHCGHLTYTGTFYPLRNILSEAIRDDLEARNQMCWVRKMISRVPESFDNKQEVETYTKLIDERLLSPELKYRSVLPLIAVLYFQINAVAHEPSGTRTTYDSLHFWINHYTFEINTREYSLWNWPHASYIKFEYGVIEKNWEGLINSMVIEE